MGNIFQRVDSEQELDGINDASNEEYCYPTKSGPYFGGHFIMGGERFETCQPEAYLFGENSDLNFLGSKPLPFPYSGPLPNEPSRTLRALINIRKETLRLVKVDPNNLLANPPTTTATGTTGDAYEPDKNDLLTLYNIEFVFDSDVKCSITIHYICTEENSPSGITFRSRNDAQSSPLYIYPKGANQLFSQPSHIFDPSRYSGNDLIYHAYDDVFGGHFDSSVALPIVVQCTALEGEEPRQSHILIATVERNHEYHYSIKPFKQKNFINGLTYLIQEIYGIENKIVRESKKDKNSILAPEDEIEDNGYECVICMSETRDTMILPCKHLCLCNACADSLRYQANNCPICRSPFRALLQLKAVCPTLDASIPTPVRLPGCTPPAITPGQATNYGQRAINVTANDVINLPLGYQPVPLIEALNGPCPVYSHTSKGNYSFRSTDSKPIKSNNGTRSLEKKIARSESSVRLCSKSGPVVMSSLESISLEKGPSQSVKNVRASKMNYSFDSCDKMCNRYPSPERSHYVRRELSYNANKGPSNAGVYEVDLLKCLPNQDRRSTINLSEYKVLPSAGDEVYDNNDSLHCAVSAVAKRRHTLSKSSLHETEIGSSDAVR